MPCKMEIVKSINTYYKKITDLLLEVHHDDFQNALPGHCMKITGLGVTETEFLWDIIHEKWPAMDTFIVSENNNGSEKFISATKLVELRNKQDAPLLVLIPSNSRTAAEDSYGNATFKEISLEGIEQKLKDDLIRNIPVDFSHLIKNDILQYFDESQIGVNNIINYLLALEECGYSNATIGNNIYFLDLIPDENLIESPEKVRSRLNFNLKSISVLSSFSKPLYDRIADLPLEPNTLQKELAVFLKRENRARNAREICLAIFQNYYNDEFFYLLFLQDSPSSWEDMSFFYYRIFP